MKQPDQDYLIHSVSGRPDWNAVPALSVDRVLWLPDRGIRAWGQLCHDAAFLYVRLRAREAEIRAEYTAPLSPVCEDSCLEFFFMPEGETRYFNFEINPLGCLYIGFGHGREDSTALFRPDLRERFDIRTERTPEGWTAEYRIPLAFLQLFMPGFTFSGRLRANVYKCGDQTVHPHYLAWHPVQSETPDFHRPCDFGIMTFG